MHRAKGSSELYSLFMTFVSEGACTRAYICFTFATPCVISSLIKLEAVKWMSITLGAFLLGFAGQISFIDV